MTVLVTRPEPHNTELVIALKKHGMHAVGWPSLSIEPPLSWQAVDQALSAIKQHDKLIFVSQHAVTQLVQYVDVSRLHKHVCFAVGKGTADALKQHGFHYVTYPEQRADSEHLIEQIAQDTSINHRVWIFRGQSGREYLANTLAQQGAEVHYVSCYRRVANPHLAASLQKPYDLIICTSLDGLKALYAAWDHAALPLVSQSITVASDTMLAWAKAHGFTTCHQLPSLANPAIVAWCQDWINTRHETC